MQSINKKQHWETIYKIKSLDEVSWFQPKPTTSIAFLHALDIPKNANIIDVGGGDSFFVDNLIALGFQHITVLDISEAAIERAKKRIGKKAQHVRWIITDVVDFKPNEKYDFWHDRAVFHFLTSENDIKKYINIAQENIAKNGFLIMGTFSEKGPTKCSGIEIKQYTKKTLDEKFTPYFDKLRCFTINHKTPFNTVQNFVFCSFKKK